VEEFYGTSFDVVITVCDGAARNCPVWLGKGKTVHIGFPDPAAARGSEADQLEVFRKVRDGLHQKILAYLEQMEKDTEPEPDRRGEPGFQL
jgi:arsenate reductase